MGSAGDNIKEKKGAPFSDKKSLSLIQSYISVARNRGYPDQGIIEALRKAGWKEEQVNYAFGSIETNPEEQKIGASNNSGSGKPKKNAKYALTGIQGLDALLGNGIPEGASVIIAGGPGSGKTILCLQIAKNAAKNNEKVLYVSLEEHPKRLREHMADFGWDADSLEKKDILRIVRVDPFRISRQVEGLLAKAKGELMMDIGEISNMVPEKFAPAWVIIDSITALESAFKDDEDSYRIYIEQLFRYFEKLGVNLFLISETENVPRKYSKEGVEEFLADGVIVLYHIKRKNTRERAIEVLKLRGAEHKSQIVAMQIKAGEGVKIFPEQEVFGDIE